MSILFSISGKQEYSVMNVLSLSPGEKADCDTSIADPYEDFALQRLFEGEDQEQNQLTPSLFGSGANECAHKCKGPGTIKPGLDRDDKYRSKRDHNISISKEHPEFCFK